jgi:hypothetical protein
MYFWPGDGGRGGGGVWHSCTHLHNVLKLVKKELLQPFGHEYDPRLLVGVVTQGVSEHQLHVVPVKNLIWSKMLLSFFSRIKNFMEHIKNFGK